MSIFYLQVSIRAHLPALRSGQLHLVWQPHGYRRMEQHKAAYRNFYQRLIKKLQNGTCMFVAHTTKLWNLSIVYNCSSVWIYVAGLILFNGFGILIGLVMYANLAKCDPFTAGTVNKIDQVLPYFVMEVGKKVPGLSGIFVAGIFSAALSTMSGLLNTMSCMIYDDFLRNRFVSCIFQMKFDFFIFLI